MTVFFQSVAGIQGVHVIKVLEEPVIDWRSKTEELFGYLSEENEHVLFYTCYKQPVKTSCMRFLQGSETSYRHKMHFI